MHRFQSLMKYGKIVGITATAVSSSVFVGHCLAPAHGNPAGLPESSTKWDYNWDRREPYSLIKPPKSGAGTENLSEQLEKKKAKATRHLILIRHGQYNMEGECDSDQKLTELGREQAKYTGERLKTLGIKFTHFVSSNLIRARETADIIQSVLKSGMEIQRDPVLNEGAPIAPEPPNMYWKPDEHEFFRDGSRIEAGFRKYFHRAKPDQEEDSFEVIVCHGNVIRYFFCRALQFPPEAWLRINLNHASVTYISILPTGRVVLKALGDSGHIPPEKITVS